jgi:hypothetical protein
LLDNHEFHRGSFEETGRSEKFEKAWSKCQRTWGGLIKILLSYENENHPTLQEVKTFQKEKLGTNDSNSVESIKKEGRCNNSTFCIY